jgi:hypothetical protein
MSPKGRKVFVMSNNENNPMRGIDESLFTEEAFNMDEHRLGAKNRLALLNEYADTEFAAFRLFQKIGKATLKGGLSAETEFAPDMRPDRGCLTVMYPLINYDPDPSDSSARRQILLKEVHLASGAKVVSVTPWLQVFTMDTLEEQRGLDSSDAEVTFIRGDLEALCGWNDFGDADAIGNDLLLDPTITGDALRARMAIQAEYVSWLNICAQSLDMPRQFSPPPMEYQADQNYS